MRMVRRYGSLLVPVVLATAAFCYASPEAAVEQAAETAASAPAAPEAAPHASTWHVREVEGVEYLPLEDLRSFYKLMPMQPKGRKVAGQRTLGNGEVTLVFGPEPRELRVQERLCMLSHPVMEDSSGDLLVSKLDVLQLIEPVLRPTYIANRSAVRTVVIDPAHGGHDTGSVTPYAREADVALAVAAKLGAELQKRGYEVCYTQEQNQYQSSQARVDKANAAPAAVFISLHLNSGRSDMEGAQTYTLAPCDKGDKTLPGHEFSRSSTALALALQSSMVEKAGTVDGGCRRAHFSLLNSVRCPSVMVEMGYATHPEEGTRLSTEEYQIKLAAALADGVDAFARVMNPGTNLQVQKAPVVAPPPPAPVKVAPAQPKPKTDVKKTVRPARKKAPVRRAPARKTKNRRNRK